jgi:GT2 family glycosyltransferase/glycosyltransferase involved in cell wall biosynthesis
VKVRPVGIGEDIGASRGDVVVCVPVYGGHDLFIGCLRSVLKYTPANARILICDDASPDARSEQLVRELERSAAVEHELFYLRRRQNVGFPANVNGAFAAAAPADVIVLNSDCVVSEGWIEGLQAAAYVDSRVATATALTNHGSLASVPDSGRPMPHLPEDWDFDHAAAAIRARSLRVRPRVPTAIGHCMFIRRSALELIGDFDLAFSPGYGEEVDFSQRCLRSGLCHVLADDVLVLHHGGGSFGSHQQRDAIQHEHERIIAARYPYYHDGIKLLGEVGGPVARTLNIARRALSGLSVTIDARILSGPMTGTQLHVLELIAALARTGSARVSAVVSDELSSYAVRALTSLEDVTLLTRSQAKATPRADVMHRPFQIHNGEDLAFLASLGERLVVTNQDLISYHNPSYFKDFESWENYRRVTRGSLAVADRVVFFSSHARDDALAEDLVDPGRASVVHIGVDHTFAGGQTRSEPRGAEPLASGAEAILCLGTDFRHKNRIFALRVLEQLQRRHGWDGYLLLAGPRVERGSSVPEEAEMLMLHPGVAEATLNFAAVSEAEKAWLFDRSRLALYPTIHEGFGLIPFEAADYGVPCMWAKGTSLGEILPDGAAEIICWNAEESADRAFALLRDEQACQRNLGAIRGAAAPLSWDATAQRLLELYHTTCDGPAAPAGAFDRRHGIMQGTLSEDAMRLMGPGGALPEGAARPLLALATHPRIGVPVFRAIGVGYRASHRLRRAARTNGLDPHED